MLLRKLREREGGISVFTIIILAFLLPFVIWIGIELPKMHEANQRVKDAVDSAAASTVTILNNGALEAGSVQFQDSVELEKTARQMFALKMGVNYDPVTTRFSPKEGSRVSEFELTEVHVQTLDDRDLLSNGVRTEKTLTSRMSSDGSGVPDWEKKVKHPTVVVEATITFKKIGFFGKDLTVRQVGMSQVKMRF